MVIHKIRGKVLGVSVASLGLMALLLLCPTYAAGQGLEFNGGWSHITGDFGQDGFNVGTAWFFSPSFDLEAHYDDAWDNSTIGTFEFTNVGAIASKSHIQDFLIGPRFYFPQHKVDKINPFAEAQFGVSHLASTVQEGPVAAAQNAESAFAWALGGGVDYPINPHLRARGELDLLRTHFSNSAQSRLRLAISLAYTFGAR